MRHFARPLMLAALLVLPASSVRAQTVVDPSGHWEGKVEVPQMDVIVEVDLAKNSKGEFEGTVGIPAQHLKGLPLKKVVVQGRTINFHARTDQTLSADLSDDGKSMSGTFAIEGAALPFSLTRTGDARMMPPVKSAAIGKELEGTWNGTLEAGMPLRLVLTMSNQADGTATGRIVNLDQGGLEIPLAIAQKGSSVTLDTSVVPGSFSGALNAEGTELAGTWTQGSIALPLTFKRVVP
ncbi:MAG: hypothetical protein HY047_20620 [Acidobacteria bacterium]|nr:hypothetical protein [Acidobacteriota bacterium]